jgi:L-2-hydroxyglutarate oxidase LhgO
VNDIECVVVGAGVLGLATARALSLAGRDVLVLDRAYTIGFETSSRNSEVIHAGLYYPAGSLKARCCVAGRKRLYAFCREHGVPHAQIGKLIVAAQESEIAGIERIADAARANGVDDLQWLTATQARRLEPALNCAAALLSPSTGIIDSHALMLAFQGEAEAGSALVVLRTPLLSGRVRADGFELAIGGEEPTTIRCRCLVNAAGLCAPALARIIDGIPPETIPTAYFCRGVYFSLAGRAPFRHLVYPVPSPGGLGVHLPSTSQAKRDLARMSSGFLRLITLSILGAPRISMRRSVPTGRSCAAARYSPATPGFGRRSPGPMNHLSISSCRVRRFTACRG